MRNRILIITTIIVIMLFIVAVSAGEIKGVKKEAGSNNNRLLIVTTDKSVTSVLDNGEPLIEESSNGVKQWKKEINDIEDNGISQIEADGKSLHVNGHYDGSGNGGCLSREGYEAHSTSYSLAHVDLINNNLKTTYYLDTQADSEHPNSGIIGICIYPSTFDNPTLNLLYDSTKWEIKHNSHWDYFGFGRITGNEKIPLSTDTDIGTATYMNNIPTQQNILLHIYDSKECSTPTKYEETCWRRPGTTIIPEFSTVAIPIAGVLGLVFFFQHRKKKEE